MPARETEAEMYPGIAGLPAVFTTLRARGDLSNLIAMRAFCRHVLLPRRMFKKPSSGKAVPIRQPSYGHALVLQVTSCVNSQSSVVKSEAPADSGWQGLFAALH